MKKILTKKETLKSGSNVTYFKLHFGSQWFMVVPWHYEPAKLMDVFNLCANAVEGETYDIKWRGAKIGGRTATLLTCLNPVVEEFVWDGEEMGGEDSSNTSSAANSGVLDTSPKPSYQEQPKVSQNPSQESNLDYDPFGEDEWTDIPF